MNFINAQLAISFAKGVKTLSTKREGDKFYFDNGIIATRTISNSLIKTSIENTTQTEVPIYDIYTLNDMEISKDFTRAYISAQSMTGTTIEVIGKNYVSYDLVGFSTINEGKALLIGALSPIDAFYRYDVNGHALSAVCEREGVPLKGNSTLTISDITLWEDSSLSALLNKYGKRSGEMNKARVSNDIMTGWCSWYYYYGEETKEDIIGNVKELADSEFANDIKVIQMDDGWNYSGRNRQWGDWKPLEKFNYSMLEIVEVIHDNGFKAGLWLAPFSVTKNSQLYANHPEWLIENDSISDLEGPAELPGGYLGLDLTHPEALEFLRATFEDVFNNWNFDYVKLDFLMCGVAKGKRYDKTKTAIEAFRDGMQIIRDIAGDRFILCCGSPLGGAIGLCDAMRVGLDVGATWHLNMNPKGWKHGNCSIKPAAYPSLLRQWMHKNLWQNDPDCIVVRDCLNDYDERAHLDFPNRPILTYDEAVFWVRAVWITGSMALLSEVLSKLTPERYNLLKHSFPINKKDIKIIDMYENIDVFAFESDDKTQFGIFNLSDEDYIFEGNYDGYFEMITKEEFKSPLVLKPHTAAVYLSE